MKYLALDCEFSGLIPGVHSLLTAAFIVAEEDGTIVDKLDLAVLPDGPRGRGNYIVCMDAMNINQINLSRHDEVAYTREEATKLLEEFLRKHSLEEYEFENFEGHTEIAVKKEYLIPLGHNMNLDIQFIKLYFSGLDWEKYVSYRNLDTASISRFLKGAGVLNIEHISLPGLAEHFGVVYAAHNAMEDARATLEVFLGMQRVVKALLDSALPVGVEDESSR